jgi:cytidylate kinase
MRCNAERLIEALIAVEMMKMHEQSANDAAETQQKTTVVTVSRDFGAMGREVAMLLADVLEVRCCDRDILQEVARRANVDEELVRVLDEHVQNIGQQLWQKLMHKDALDLETYHELLVKTVLSISRSGGVIIGRGGNLILGADRSFRVRIAGSDSRCADRVARREKLSHEQALKRVQDVDRERMEYIRKVYRTDICDHSSYDLVLNSDRYGLVQMTELILEAMEKAGYRIPEDAMKSVRLLAEDNKPVWMAMADSDSGCGRNPGPAE